VVNVSQRVPPIETGAVRRPASQEVAAGLLLKAPARVAGFAEKSRIFIAGLTLFSPRWDKAHVGFSPIRFTHERNARK